MKKEMLINVLQPEECRIAIVEDGTLEELYVERASQESYVNNIYKGRIVNIEPSIQAAFVDFGIGRNGFLHVSDVDPVYYKHLPESRGGDRRDRGGDRGNDRGNDRGGDRGGDRGRGRGERNDRGGDRNDRGRLPFTPVVIPSPEAVPPEFEEEVIPPTQELTGWLEPGMPIIEGPTVVDDGFGGGILEESAPPAPEEEAAPEEAPSEAPRRRGGRGRSRKKPETDGEAPSEPAAEEVAESRPRRRGKKKPEGEEAPASESAPEAPAADAPPTDDDKSRFMNSAERRTTGDEPEIDGGINFDPFAPNDRFSGSSEGPEPTPAPVRENVEAFSESDSESESESESEMESESEVSESPEEAPNDDARDAEEIENIMEGDDEEGEEGYSRGGSGPRRNDRGGDRDRGGRRGGRDGGRDGGGRPGQRRGGTFSRDGGRPKPPIQEIFKRGQEVIVQVIKEGIGTKGPTLSTYISIAGRYLVLMPSLNRVAVSRKIEDESIRTRLKQSLTELNPPKGIGFIIRTAAIDRNKAELRNDLSYLVRLWEVFASRVLKRPAPVEIYRESDMITRTIRDIFTADIDSIWVDEANAFTQAAEFLKIVMPRYADRIKHHADTEPIFTKFRIDHELARINEKKLALPMGGSIVIEQTEALVAIDVNSGNFRAENNAEETAYQMNLQAAKEIGRQLRLRDLGGVIVNDFIDMKEERHRRNVEQALRNALRRDRARTKILKTSAFGVIEMTRQRIRPSLKRSIYSDCPHCRATGYIKTSESMSIEIMRLFQMAAHRKTIRQLNAKCHVEVAHYLLNKKRKELLNWEEIGQMQIMVQGVPGISPEFLELQGFDNNGNEVKVTAAAEPVKQLPDRRPHEEHRDQGRGGNRGGRGGDRGGDRGGRGRGRDRE